MDMSISKQQAEALAEGFLDNIGSSEELRPKETFTDIILLGAEFVEDAQDNLIKANRISSGALSESLQIGEPEVEGSFFKINIYMNFYGKFINAGVAGTISGTSTAGYSFKYDMPSKSMLKAISEWIKRAKISTRTVKQYRGYGKHEIRRRSISEYDNAFAVARSIKQHGIKPTGFLDKAVDSTITKVKDRLGLALKIDIINSITR